MADTDDRRCQEVLERRARRLATAPRSREQRAVDSTVAIVAIGGERFGFPVEGVRQLVPRPPVAPLPGLPRCLRGVAQVRGEIVSVVDTAAWWGIPATTLGYLLILDGPAGAVGLLVDSVVDFRPIHADELVAGLADGATSRPVRGMTRELVALVDLARLFDRPELSVGQGIAPRTTKP